MSERSNDRPNDDDRRALERAAQGGLCAACHRARLVRSSKGGAFVMCSHPRLPKYPRVPVLRCPGYERRLEG